MSLAAALLAPFALLLPVAEATQWMPEVDPASSVTEHPDPDLVRDGNAIHVASDSRDSHMSSLGGQGFGTRSFLPHKANQVRIEQSLRIRIAPQGPVSPPRNRPDMLVGIPQRTVGESHVERRMGRCIPIGNIAGVQPDGGNDLILYLRDRRMVRAQLERECRARDFYSGFYLSRSSDGRLCADRDMLQSRSGANCKISEMRQLIGLSR